MNTTQPHRQGECPACQEHDLDYQGSMELQDQQAFYRWTCSSCGATGQEWYEMVFVSHEAIQPPQDE